MADELSQKSLQNRLKIAVDAGDLTKIKRLIKGGVSCNFELRDGGYLLHEAVRCISRTKAADMVQLLIAGKAAVNAKSKDGRTALHLACKQGLEEVVSTLIRAGADVNSKTKDHRSCLHISVWKKQSKIITDLVKNGAKVNSKDEDLWTPLHWAASKNSVDTAQFLIQHGASLTAADRLNKLPLHEAAANNHYDMMKLLVKHGSQVNSMSKRGTVMSLMSRNNVPQNTIQLLLAAGFNPHADKRCSQRDEIMALHNSITSGGVPNLAQISRTAIRSHLRLQTNGRTICHAIEQLPVPKPLQEYISLYHELHPG